MTLSPNIKKALSVVAASAAGALITFAQKTWLPMAPEATQAALVAIATGLTHWLNTWGHAERVEAIATDAVAKANAAGAP